MTATPISTSPLTDETKAPELEQVVNFKMKLVRKLPQVALDACRESIFIPLENDEINNFFR